jgi:hypothetical protein
MPTILVPIDLRNPRVSSLAGNAYWRVAPFTAYDSGHWEFLNGVDGKIYGAVTVPQDVTLTPNAKIVLIVCANNISGNVVLQVSTKPIAPLDVLDPPALTAESAQTIAMPNVARARQDVVFPPSGSLADTCAEACPLQLLIVEIYRNGMNAADNLPVPLELHAAYLQVDVM